MMLVLQIAAGIVLGFAIIAYRHSLLYLAQALAICAAVVAFVFGLVTLGSMGIEAGGPALAKYTAKLGIALGAGLLISCIALGAYGLALLCKALNFQTKLLAGHYAKPVIANIIIVYLVFLLLSFVPPAAALYDFVNNWSRSNGYKDAGSSAIFGVAQQWPWLALGVMHLMKREPSMTDED